MSKITLGAKFLNIAEIHYFRVSPKDWEDRILKAKNAGFQALASYIPWLVHEENKGEYDFSGQYDVARFIELVAEYDMYFIARPGPFVMAELKNEGIPYWVYEEKPHVIPITWNNRKVEGAQVIYNHPDFLSEVDRWYTVVADIIRPRLVQNGGNIVAVQLDNEIGMLQWVNNTPDLSDFTLGRFIDWLLERYNDFYRYGFELIKSTETFERLRTPGDEFVRKFVSDYSLFSRYDFGNYVKNLRDMFWSKGIQVPFIVNIHGTSGGRAHTFPIGISQLRNTFILDNVIPATDIYLGDYTIKNVTDLWNINEVLRSITRKPFGVMEFECGSGDYGNNLGERIDPNATLHKAIVSYIQGNRFLNYYLFSGGINPKLKNDVKDGNARIAFTGEEHGFAAPVKPNGQLDYTYDYIKFANNFLFMLERNLGNEFSLMYDNITVAYLDEYYRTEYSYGSDKEKRSNIEIHRGYNLWDSFLKTLFIMGYRYKFVDLEHSALSSSEILIVPSARYMSKEVQQKIVDFISAGGKAIIYGDLPIFDEDGDLCTLLIDFLRIQPGREFFAAPHFYLSVSSSGNLFREFRTDWAREILIPDNDDGNTSLATLAHVTQVNAVCSVFLKNKNAVVITTHLNANFNFFEHVLELLEFKPRIKIFTDSRNAIGALPFVMENVKTQQRFLLIVNIDNFPKEVRIMVDKIDIGTKKISSKGILFEKIPNQHGGSEL